MLIQFRFHKHAISISLSCLVTILLSGKYKIRANASFTLYFVYNLDFLKGIERKLLLLFPFTAGKEEGLGATPHSSGENEPHPQSRIQNFRKTGRSREREGREGYGTENRKIKVRKKQEKTGKAVNKLETFLR